MRMYALYERSRKVLAFYIIVAAVILVVACVGLNLDASHDLPSLILWYIVGSTEWKRRNTLEHSHSHRLQYTIESGKVSTLP